MNAEKIPTARNVPAECIWMYLPITNILSLQQYLCLSETVETRLGLFIFYWEKICVANEWLESENNGKYKDNNNIENLPFKTNFQSQHKGSTNLMTNSSSVLGLEPLEINNTSELHSGWMICYKSEACLQTMIFSCTSSASTASLKIC